MNAPAQTARQQLAQALVYHREQRKLTRRDISDRVGGKLTDVEAWESGALVPEPWQWARYHKMVSRALGTMGDVYRRALDEAKAEKNTITKGISMHTPKQAATNLGDKLRAALPSSTKPAADVPPLRGDAAMGTVTIIERPERESMPIPIPLVPRAHGKAQAIATVNAAIAAEPRKRKRYPEGSMTFDAMMRRRQFVREMIISRPNIRTQGRDSIYEALLKTFGVGMANEDIERVRTEVAAERGEYNPPPAPSPPPPAPPVVSLQPMPGTLQAPPEPRPTEEVNEGDLAAAVDLVLSAVPHLRAFSITVDDSGAASVDYTVREVVVREKGGSLKVGRRS